MSLFQFLVGISPWWWLAFGVVLGALEMATMSFFLIWPAMAAGLIAALLLVAPQTNGEIQIASFAILSIALTFVGRSMVNRLDDGGEAANTINSRASLMVGRQGEVLDVHGHEGNVLIDGIRWRAHWPDTATAKPGDKVIVDRAEGMTLVIKP